MDQSKIERMLRLGLRAKNLLLEEYPLAAKEITRKGAYWILETGVYDYAGVCRFYCGLADDIEIVGSPELGHTSRNMRENISSDKIFQKQNLLHPNTDVRFA